MALVHNLRIYAQLSHLEAFRWTFFKLNKILFYVKKIKNVEKLWPWIIYSTKVNMRVWRQFFFTKLKF